MEILENERKWIFFSMVELLTFSLNNTWPSFFSPIFSFSNCLTSFFFFFMWNKSTLFRIGQKRYKDDTPLANCANVWATLYMAELDRPKLVKMGHGTSYNIGNRRRRISETKHGIRYYLRFIDKLLSLCSLLKL